MGSRQKSDAVGACSSEPDDVESGKQTTESDVPVPDSTGVADTKDSILRDLVHLYLYVLGNFDLHENARVAANGAPSTQENSKHSHQNQSSAKSGKRPGLDVLVHRILDGKLFVKEYTSERLLLKKSLDQQQSIGVHDRRGDDLSGGNTVLCALQFEKGNPCWQTHLSYESVSVLTCLCFCQGLNKKPAQSPSEVIHLPSDANMADLMREAFS